MLDDLGSFNKLLKVNIAFALKHIRNINNTSSYKPSILQEYIEIERLKLEAI